LKNYQSTAFAGAMDNAKEISDDLETVPVFKKKEKIVLV